MHRYFIKTPWWLHKLFPSYTWYLPANDKTVYLTFDDGPHPTITPWVLRQLKEVDAKATFFCIGENVVRYPETFALILSEGHAVGNHTQHHLNGWKADTDKYVRDVMQAQEIIGSSLFRPPYGRIRREQARIIKDELQPQELMVVMWTVLSCDFDRKFSPERCARNVLKNVEPGSIIVFHDSEKAEENLRGSLPVVLKSLRRRGYKFGKINKG